MRRGGYIFYVMTVRANGKNGDFNLEDTGIFEDMWYQEISISDSSMRTESEFYGYHRLSTVRPEK